MEPLIISDANLNNRRNSLDEVKVVENEASTSNNDEEYNSLLHKNEGILNLFK